MSLGLEIPVRNRKRTASRDLVWPPWAEPGFVQAVNDYFSIYGTLTPRASKRTQNKFIAERLQFYTGLVRTRTQVSSHLQQRRGWFRKFFGTLWDDAILALPTPGESASPCASTSSSSSSYTSSTNPAPAPCVTLPNAGHPPQPSSYANDYLRSSNLSPPWSPDGFPAAVPVLQAPHNRTTPYDEFFPNPSLGFQLSNASPAECAWPSGPQRASPMRPTRASCYEPQLINLEYSGAFVWPSSF